ncbi:MAG: polymer-forming cytoskeletal protein [Betaproteobacteria bacterium]|jgi:cytoskeletal protein CcmA (bactofilin family)|nr:polymer-forming cytoskeletal protein [Betaproteobacteria bacterium]
MNEEKNRLDRFHLSDSITIGQGVTFVGSISARGYALINGDVKGEISVDHLQVGQYGVIRGKIISREMGVQGEIHNEVSCSEHVLVYSTGLINGKLSYGELEIQKGGRVAGIMDQSFKIERTK